MYLNVLLLNLQNMCVYKPTYEMLNALISQCNIMLTLKDWTFFKKYVKYKYISLLVCIKIADVKLKRKMSNYFCEFNIVN